MTCSYDFGDFEGAASRQIVSRRIAKRGKMDCEECNRLERFVLESMIAADKAETALRCYLLTHQWSTGVSDLAEYHTLRAEEQATADERHGAYMDFVKHKKDH